MYNFRPILYVTFQLVILGGYSVHLLLINEAQEFANFGAFVIAWAILHIAFGRNKFTVATDRWEAAKVQKQFNQVFKLIKFRDHALNTTFNLHASQIAQINKILGQDNPFVEIDDIPEFVERVEYDMSRSEEFLTEQKELEEEMKRFLEEYSGAQSLASHWTILMWRLELILVAIGTLQTTFGQNIVAWYHS